MNESDNLSVRNLSKQLVASQFRLISIPPSQFWSRPERAGR